MDKKIEKIINDLYMIDGSFKKHEKELAKIVEELLLAKPDAEVNEEFVEKLHLELARRMKYLKEERVSSMSMVGDFNFFGKLAYSLMGATLMLVVVLVGVIYTLNLNKNHSDGIAMDLTPRIEKVKDGAFGSLAFNQSKAPSGLGIGGGGGLPASADQKSGVSMPNPEIVNYRFVYKGGDIPIEDAATVYKRVKDLSLGDKIAESLKSLDLGLIDLSKFNNTQITSLSITEDRDFGYDVNLDLREGLISVYPGTRWGDPNAGCTDEACYEKNRLKESDLPKNEELIAIANKFLDDYKIDKSSYGEPAVVKDYGFYKGPMPTETTVYVPETIPVVYPLKINGQTVYDDTASPMGITVDVSIRQKKAFGARNIYTQKYESSNYEAEQDKNKIILVAENGGLYGNYRAPEATQTVNIELGTPKIELIASWNYDSEKRISENLFIPSYVFPVLSVQDGKYFYRTNITVPVPKEMLEKINQFSATTPPGIILK